MTLRNRSISAVKWSAIERLGAQSVQFVISIILARLLLPEQFGLIAMLTIFFAVAQTFVDSGFGVALIQKKDPSQLDKCSIFYFNILVGVVFAVLIFLSAPVISDFYSQPLLIPLTQFLSVNLIINSFSLVQSSMLSKELDFKSQAKISLISASLSGVVGVVLALNDFGVWALAFQQVVSSTFRTLLLWVLSRWRPNLIFSWQSISEMFGYSSKMLAAGLLDNLFKNIYLLVIGKFYPPALLGFYVRAQGLKDVVALNLTKIISSVAFPAFSCIQEDNVQLKRGLKSALLSSAFFIFPAMAGMAAVAEPLIVVLLTEKWLPSVPYLQMLCVVGMLLPLQALNLSIIKSKGRSDIYLWLEVLKKLLIVINVSLTWNLGVDAMIVGHVIISFFSYFINSYFTKRMIGYSVVEQIIDISPVILLSIVMGIFVYSLGFLLYFNFVLLLVCQVLGGAAFYLGLSRLLNLKALVSVLGMLGRRKRP